MSQHPWLKYKEWAVVGASQNEDSYGYKITKRLLDSGYKTVPIAPKYERVCGEVCYRSLRDYEGSLDVIDFVVNPRIGLKILDDVAAIGVTKIILQPGTSSPQVLDKAKALGIEVLESCVLVLLSWK